MPLPVSLDEVVDILDSGGAEWHACINRKTGDLVGFTDEDISLAKQRNPDVGAWHHEVLAKVREVLASNDFVELPGSWKFESKSAGSDTANRRSVMWSPIS